MSAKVTRPRGGQQCLADRIYPQVRSMTDDGLSQNEIAERLHVSQATVGRSLWRNAPDRPGVPETPKPTMQTLYRMFDVEGRLLYVGISVNPMSRMKHHSGVQPWWEDVARIEMEKYATRDEVMEAERRAVENENPRYNVRLRPARDLTDAEREARRIAGLKGSKALVSYNKYRGARTRLRMRAVFDDLDLDPDHPAMLGLDEDEALVAEYEAQRKGVAA